MTTREQSVRNFISSIDEIISSNYILASKKISVLLRTVASSKLLYELFEFCNEGFDYPSARARLIVEGESAGRGSFTMPKGGKNVIAFVFRLLYDIDADSSELTRLLTYCFFDGTFNDSFKRFASEVLVPFKEEVVTAAQCMLGADIISGGSSAAARQVQVIAVPVQEVRHAEPEPQPKPQYEPRPQPQAVQKPQTSHKKSSKKADASGIVQIEMPLVSVSESKQRTLSSRETEKIRALLVESRSLILQYKMESALKAEFMELYDDFSNALTVGDPEHIKRSFLGYKYTTLYHRKKPDAGVEKIQKILTDSGILNGD